MLKVELNKETHVADIRATGTVLDITSDVAYLIQTLYNELAPEVRAWFRVAVSELVNGPVSPVWKPDKDKGNAIFAFFSKGAGTDGE